jgi:hypothetical protein
MKSDSNIGFPVNRELLPALLMQGARRRKRAGRHDEHIPRQNVEKLRRSTFICGIKGEISVPGISLASFRNRSFCRATARTRIPLRMPASTTCRPT